MEQLDKKELAEILQNRIVNALLDIESIDAMATKFGFTNEQWFIDFQDKLNEISVKDPNK